MKKIPLLLILSIVIASFCACSDFMEYPQSASFNIDSVFSKYRNAERLLSDMYKYPIPIHLETTSFGSAGLRLNGGSFASSITDEGQAFHVQAGYLVQQYYIGNVDASYSATYPKGEDDYPSKWKTLRKAYILIENIDHVPDATVEQKERIKGECKLMVATVYFEMLKRYGGVPIIRSTFNGEEASGVTHRGRNTFEETYQFILETLEDVIHNYKEVIPANYTDRLDEFGHFPLAFAYALKARVMLYAASPLHNTDKPYNNALGTNSNLICFMNKDNERWKQAAEAATEAIDFCLANGYKVLNEPNDRENGMNYTNANIEYPDKGNTEVIWGMAQKASTSWGILTFVRGLPDATGWAPNMVPLNQVERYEIDDDATPGKYKSWESQQIFDTDINPKETDGNKAKKLLAAAARKAYEEPKLDPRFYASVAYNGVADYGKWGPLGDIDMADAYADDGSILSNLHGVVSEGKNRTTICQFMRKYTRGYEGREASMYPLNIYMRMADLYLMRAEALNEYHAAPPQQVHDDLNLIRQRSGMCNVKATADQKEMREIVAHERNIEMFYEDHRWFDLRRTLKSAEKIPVEIYKIQIRKWYHTADDKWPYKITYDKMLYSKRWWNDKLYMNPFPKDEIIKDYGLIQNPGW